jgi:glycosyltransferase involved in cell wall biosynthesis
MSPSASIIINNFNYERFVGEAIDSALAQSWADVEVIVVDDGSSDGSRREIERRSAEVKTVFKDNGGQASCFNAGFEASRGDVVIFLDADDVLLPSAVERVMGAFASGTVAKVHWPLWEIGADGTRTPKLRPEALLPRGDLLPQTIDLGPRSHTNPPTSGNAWARTALDEMLPMPEREYTICADAYLVALAPLFGDVERLLEPQALWRRHEENKFNSSARTIEQRLVDELWRYGHIAQILAEILSARGQPVEPALWKRRNGGYKRLDRMLRAVTEIRRLVPEGAAYVLADDGDWSANGNWAGSEIIAGRRAIPFAPPSGEGTATMSSQVAIERLEQLRHAGATHVFFAWPATWLLDHHPDLQEHLRCTARPVIDRGMLTVFELRADEPVARERDRSGTRQTRAAEIERLRRRRTELLEQRAAVEAEVAALRDGLARAQAAPRASDRAGAAIGSDR